MGEINSNDPKNKLGLELFEMVGPAAFQKIGQQFNKLSQAGGKAKSQSEKLQNRRGIHNDQATYTMTDMIDNMDQ